MQKEQKDHILQNLVLLADSTKHEQDWIIQLLMKKLISQSTLERIRETERSPVSRIQKLYVECQRTAAYDILIQTLKHSKNDDAAKLLETYSGHSSCTSSRESTNGFEDFSVSDFGIVEINTILVHFPKLKEGWVIVPIMLKLSGESQGLLEDMETAKAPFGKLLFKTLQLWLQEKGKEAKFKDLVDIIETRFNNTLAKDALIGKWKQIRDAK